VCACVRVCVSGKICMHASVVKKYSGLTYITIRVQSIMEIIIATNINPNIMSVMGGCDMLINQYLPFLGISLE